MSSSPISTDGNTLNHEKSMSQIRHTRNIFYAESIDAAENYILSKIATSSEGFDLQIPSAFYFTWRFQEFLDLAQERNQVLRFRYFPDDCRLQIVPMGSPVHSSFCLALSYSLLHNIKADFFLERLQKRLNIGTIQTSMDDFDDDQPAQRPAQKKAPAVRKNPDSAIIYRSLRGGQSITVIVEVGFSESYQDLLRDAEQWLLKGNEDVNLVILVDIKEDRVILKKTTSALDSRTRLKKLVAAFGNDEAKRRHNNNGDNDTNDDVSGPTVTKLSPKDWKSAVESQLNIDDWVGPLSAFLEFWELKNGRCEIRGQRFPILPRSKKPVRPAIPIVDMIPISERAKFKEVDKSREMDLDMNDIRVHLRDGRQRLAFARAKEYLRPRLQDNDPTYVP
ncbi:hypothetical protein TCE0_015r02757 [Talaromyces pinophilus]|uniref:Uncharacterized protein n=1 Tax=Talaromyces pinophilus TaxID=128442 RepID=A0A6V8H0P7_TALPI|nr:hypothetical protein TCE0_015r02757 [Talaromyces pinophilus]